MFEVGIYWLWVIVCWKSFGRDGDVGNKLSLKWWGVGVGVMIFGKWWVGVFRLVILGKGEWFRMGFWKY